MQGFPTVTVLAGFIFRFDRGAEDVDYVDDPSTGRTIHDYENQPHPGVVVLQERIEPMGLTITHATEALGVTRNTLSGPRGNFAVRYSGDRPSWT